MGEELAVSPHLLAVCLMDFLNVDYCLSTTGDFLPEWTLDGLEPFCSSQLVAGGGTGI